MNYLVLVRSTEAIYLYAVHISFVNIQFQLRHLSYLQVLNIYLITLDILVRYGVLLRRQL